MRTLLVANCIAILAAGSKPNLVFLITDDQDSMLGALDVMPNYVSRIVRGGATASNAFVASPKVWLGSADSEIISYFQTSGSMPQCCPSRTSLLAGRFTHRLNDSNLGWCGDFIAEKRYDNTFIADVKVCRMFVFK